MCDETDAKTEEVNDDYITIEGIKTIVDKLHMNGLMRNIAIFIDYDNIYYGLRDYGLEIDSDQYNICKILNDIYDVNVIRKFRAYADFQQVHADLTKMQELRVQIRHVYGNGKTEKYRKNASDIELSLDAMETYYKNPNIDTFVFVTSDSDMIPIMNRLKYKGKQIHLYYIRENISDVQHINTYADLSCDLIKLLNIDTSRANPEIWVDESVKIISQWISDPRNKGKYYGGRWIQKDIAKGCGISTELATNVLSYMVDKKIVISQKNPDNTTYYTLSNLDNNQTQNEEIFVQNNT